MSTKETPEAPNHTLARIIVQALISEGLLTPDASIHFLSNLAQGKIRDSDWKVELEAALNQKKEENGNKTI